MSEYYSATLEEAERWMIEPEQCWRCKYFQEDGPLEMRKVKEDLAVASLYGSCKRYPPTVVKIDKQGFPVCAQPVVFFRDHCGEFKDDGRVPADFVYEE